MELQNKKTTLDDNAELYRHSGDNMTTKEKWKSLDAKGKWEFFKQYYLFKVVCVLVIGGVLLSVLITIFKPKPETVCNLLVSDLLMSEEEVKTVQNEFLESLGLDKKDFELTTATNCYFLTDEMNARQFFTVYYAVGDLDVVILPRKVFNMIAPNGFFLDVHEYLTADELNGYSERIVSSPRIDSESERLVDGSEYPCAIIIQDSKYVSGNMYNDSIVLAVCACSTHMDNAKKLIDFLFK